MHELLSDELAPWFASAVVLTVGSALIVAGATSICRLLKSPSAQRTAWQIGAMGLLALLAAELTGMGPALARLGYISVSGQAPAVGPTAPEKAEPPPGGLDDEAGFAAAMFADHAGVVERFSDDSAAAALAGWNDLGSPGSLGTPNFHAGFEPSLSDSADDSSSARVSDKQVRTAQAEQVASEPATVASQGVAGPAPLPWPVAIWTGVGLLLLARVVWVRFRLACFRRRCRTITDKQLRGRVDRLARRLGLRRPVRVMETAGLAAPVACGLVRPAIFLPTGFAGSFDGSRQEVILAHELAHLAGRDPAWQLLAEVLCALLWWNPLTYLVRSGLRTASEAAADEASLLVPDGPDLLAGCLVSLGRQLTQTRRFGWLSMGGSGFRSCLGKRVERLLSLSARSWRPPRRRLSAVAKVGGPLLLVFVTVFSTVWARSQTSLAEGESTMNVLTTSWRRSLAATAVMACLVPLTGGEATAGALFAEDAEHREREGAERRERVERERAEKGEQRERGERREREERGRRERDKDDRPPVRERAKLLEQAEAIERKIHGLGDGQDEKARELHQELEKIHERIGKIERELGDRDGDRGRHDVFRELIELQGRALELEVALHVLPEGQEEKARDIRRELEEIGDRVQRFERQHPDAPPEVAREMMHHRLDQLRHAVERLREAGKPEPAERMEREARELAEMIERESPERRGRRQPEGDEEKRRAHVMNALENLHAAGLHEMAEKLAREIEGRHGERPPQAASPFGPPHPVDAGPVVEELRGQMHEMRREMDELKKLLKEVLERE